MYLSREPALIYKHSSTATYVAILNYHFFVTLRLPIRCDSTYRTFFVSWLRHGYFHFQFHGARRCVVAFRTLATIGGTQLCVCIQTATPPVLCRLLVRPADDCIDDFSCVGPVWPPVMNLEPFYGRMSSVLLRYSVTRSTASHKLGQ